MSIRKIAADLFMLAIIVFGLWLVREDGFRDGKKAVMDNLRAVAIDAVNLAKSEGLCR